MQHVQVIVCKAKVLLPVHGLAGVDQLSMKFYRQWLELSSATARGHMLLCFHSSFLCHWWPLLSACAFVLPDLMCPVFDSLP